MPSYEEIQTLAYLKWERAGYPGGDGVEFWLQAESELIKECESTPTTAKKKPTASTSTLKTAAHKSPVKK